VVSSDDVSQEEDSDDSGGGDARFGTTTASTTTSSTGHYHPNNNKTICNFVFPQFLGATTTTAAASTIDTTNHSVAGRTTSIGTFCNTTMMDPVDDLLQHYQSYSSLPESTPAPATTASAMGSSSQKLFPPTSWEIETSGSLESSPAVDHLLGQYLIFGDEDVDHHHLNDYNVEAV
jgi:hypothetical protein